MKELEKLLGTTIKRGYPELLGHDVQIGYAILDDALAGYADLEPEGFFIEIDNCARDSGSPVKVGLMASELSHIVSDMHQTYFQRIANRLLYRFSTDYRISVERNTDMTTIIRGFGNELLGAMLFAKEKEFPFYREDGFSIMELKIILNKAA